MSSCKASLKLAKESLSRGDHKDALQHCKAALKADKSSYEAYILVGKAAFLLGEAGQSVLAYKKATDINATLLPAWKGFVEVYSQTKDDEGLGNALDQLLSLSEGAEAEEKRQEYARKLAALHLRQGHATEASQILRPLLAACERTDKASLPLLCQAADVEAALANSTAMKPSSQLTAILADIVDLSSPVASFAPYHESWVQGCLQQLPPLSGSLVEWRGARRRLLERCLQFCGPSAAKSGSGISTWAYHEAALSLLDQLRVVPSTEPLDAEAADGQIATELTHSFPWRATARVFEAGQLYRRMIQNLERPSKAAERRQILEALNIEVLRKGGSSEAWQTAARLHLQTGDPKEAQAVASQGLVWLAGHVNSEGPPASEVTSNLKMLSAEADLALERVDEANVAFKALAEETKGSGNAKGGLSQREAALHGLARCAVRQGKLAVAERLTQHLLATRDLPGPFQALLQCSLGSALLKSGALQGAQEAFEKGLEGLQQAGGAVTDFDLAAAHLQLGRTFWGLGGGFRSDRGFAHRQLLSSASIEAPTQGEAFAWLGRFYAEVAEDGLRAQKCFQRALALDPAAELAGIGLCRSLQQEGCPQKALKLCQDVTARSPHALWAWHRLGRLHLKAGNHQQAVLALQTALRGNASSADAWEALGAAYQAEGRLTAAVKAFSQGAKLEPAKTFCWVKSGSIRLSLGANTEALEDFTQALALDPKHLPALLGSAEALLGSARRHIHGGTLGRAAKDLAAAEVLAVRACAEGRRIRAAWKLLGDIRFCYHAVDPGDDSASTELSTAAGLLARWGQRVQKLRAASLAYRKALHIAPAAAGHWADTAAAEFQQAELARSHGAFSGEAARQARKNAERLVRGGLRLEPASAELWAALGGCAESRALREHALSRALQLDPKQAGAWAALGRLYTDAGEALLAERCFSSARSHEPTAAAVWEGMGALAALSQSGDSDRTDYYQHATKLGPGPEALLGFVEGSLRRGDACKASVFAAACRAVSAAPLAPAAHSAKGAVSEARGDFAAAAKAYATALELLQAVDNRGVSGRSLPENDASREATDPKTCSQLPGGRDIQTATQLDVGRALAKAGRLLEAVQIFSSLAREELEGHPGSLLAFGESLRQLGRGSEAEAALESALDLDAGIEVHVEAVAAMCRLHVFEKRTTAAVELLRRKLPILLEQKAASESVQALLLAVLAGVASGGSEQDLADVRGLCAQFSDLTDDIGGAEFVAAQMTVEAKAARLTQNSAKEAKLAAAATHLCPWSRTLRADLAPSALLANRAAALSVSRSGDERLLESLHSGASGSCPSTILKEAGSAGKALAAAALAALMLPGKLEAARLLKILLRWLRAEPYRAEAWLLTALVALKAAAFTHASSLLRAAAAAAAVEGEPDRRQQTVLLCASAAAFIGLAALGEGKDQHLGNARLALRSATEKAGNDPELATAILQQQARLSLAQGDAREAAAFLERSVEAAPQEDKAEAVVFLSATALEWARGESSEAAAHLLELAAGSVDSILAEMQLLGGENGAVPALQLIKAKMSLHQGDPGEAESGALDVITATCLQPCDLRTCRLHDLAQASSPFLCPRAILGRSNFGSVECKNQS